MFDDAPHPDIEQGQDAEGQDAEGAYSEAQVVESLERVRACCALLPETSERLSHGAPTFFIRDKKTFVMFHDDHHGDNKLAIWCAAPAGVQSLVVAEDPRRFFVPAYVGHRGWIGLRLDIEVDWSEVELVVQDAYRSVAPAALVARLDGDGPGSTGH